MRILNLPKLLMAFLVVTTLLQSCKDDSFLRNTPRSPNQSFSEEFDSSSAAFARGWKIINNSVPQGGGIWQNGGDALAPLFNAFSQQGSYVGFIGASYLGTTAAKGVISNWLISPSRLIKNGDKIIFFTRSQKVFGGGTDTTDFGNRLQVRINSYGDDLLVGSVQATFDNIASPSAAYDNPGNFNNTILDINPFLYEWHKNPTGNSLIDMRPFTPATTLQAYPVSWTRFEATVSGLNAPIVSRFAFRYYVYKGGNDGFGTGVGIDKVEFKSAGY